MTPCKNNTLNFGLARDQVVHLETGGNLCAGRPDVKSHWSRTFLIRDGIHFSRKGIYSRKNISCRLTKGKIWTFLNESCQRRHTSVLWKRVTSFERKFYVLLRLFALKRGIKSIFGPMEIGSKNREVRKLKGRFLINDPKGEKRLS